MLNILTYFLDSNSCMMPDFYMLLSTKNEYKTKF